MISVICVCYNSEKYIIEALDSVFSQSFKDFELIVIDDGSTDKTLDLLLKYEKFNNFTLIKNTHTGNPGLLRNKAVMYAKYEFIAFIDSDDVWLDDKLSEQLKYVNEYDMICTNAIRINEDNMVFNSILTGMKDTLTKSKNKITVQEIFYENLKNNMKLDQPILLEMNYVVPSSVLIKKQAFIESGMFEQVLGLRGEDYILWLNIADKFKILLLNKVLIKYRIHSNNLSLKSFDERIKLLERTVEIREKFYNSDNDLASISAKNGNIYLYQELSKLAISQDMFKKAIFYLNKYLKYSPDKISLNYLKYSLICLYIKLKVLLGGKD